MTQQALLRTIKRWKRYEKRRDLAKVPQGTRGFYVLYKQGRGSRFDVFYIGVGGLGTKSGIRSRLKNHNKNKGDWTHFSFFEVHDNVTTEDIRELESLLLGIFRHDPRIKLDNVQKGSGALSKLKHKSMWPPK